MIDLDLRLDCAEEKGLSAVGEIYRQPLALHPQPLVTMVIARPDRSARFSLEPGDYEYQFAIDMGEGTLALTLDRAGWPLASKSFDTVDGFAGRVFRFTVPA